ncbi:MAG TPA: hypothetical protein VFR93_09120, partial [Candidatus Limnocylindrales bacterium]|nr:hypothetical protein [Candidatus Limnocylindrales bacterium]
DLGHGPEPVDTRGGGEANRPLAHHEPLPPELADLPDDARERLTILVPGTRLEAGGTYIDLDNLAAGPFTARDGDVVPDGRRIVSKKAIDFELWNRIEAASIAARGG